MHHLTGIPDFAIPDVIAAVVAERWAIDVADVQSLGGGHSSSSWVVITASGGRLVAKLAEASAKFECGLLVAESLAGCGLRTGRPLRAVDGRICIRFDNIALAVLEFESGEPARAHVPAEARLLGRTLGAVHRSQWNIPPLSGLAAWPPRGLLETPEIDPVLRVLARTVLDDAVASADGLPVGILHGDAAPHELLIDDGGGTAALVDWGSVQAGPLLLDLATVHVGGHTSEEETASVLAGYAEVRPEVADEMSAWFALVRFAWLQQVDYFAARLREATATPWADQAFDRYGFERSSEILRTGVWRP